MKLPKLSDFNFSNKTVLVRGDLDVPLREPKTHDSKLKTFEVEDDTRLKACLPTIRHLLKEKAKVIILGHLGRPGGREVNEFRMAPVAEKLKELLENELPIANPKVGLRIQKIPIYVISENLWLIENLRFYPGEEENNLEFAKILSTLGDFFVNEAFAASHRNHASVVGLPKLLPHCAGYNFIKEIENLSRVLENSIKPVVFIIGGAKTETKLPVIDNLFEKVDIFLLGGVVANTFMVAGPMHPKIIGKSVVDQDQLEMARKITSRQKGERIEYPVVGPIWKVKIPTNLIVAKKENGKFSEIEVVDTRFKTGEVFDQEKMIVDIGSETEELYTRVIEQAKTIVFAGPMGIIEEERFSHGTKAVLEAIVKAKAFKIVGGGDTIAALNKFNLLSKIDFVSLGGGAMLEFLAKGTLPGIEALK